MSIHRTNPRPRISAATAALLLALTGAASYGITAPLPAYAATVVLQAESAPLTGGTRVETEHVGYTGTGYVGGYTAPMGAVTIAEAGEGRLTIQLAGQRALALRATGIADFDVEHVGAKVHFVEADGKIVRLDIAQRGRTLPATRN